jgi:hypothetical protein
MTDWIYSVVLIVPQQSQNDANLVAEVLGHGPDNFSVPLSSSGNEPATHYGCRTQAQQSFVDFLNALKLGQIQEIEGITNSQLTSVVDGLIYDTNGTDGYEHFNRVITENNLQIIMGEN